MGRLILLRHAKKAYRNGRPPKRKDKHSLGAPAHDPPLLAGQKEDIIIKMEEIIKQYGKIDRVICSPFLRTRQTLDIIKPLLGPTVSIDYQKEVEEFLGFQKPRGNKAIIDTGTSFYTQPLIGVESFSGLCNRADKFYDTYHDLPGTTLVISHGIFITQVYKYINHDLNHHIKELCGVMIENKKIIFF